MQSDEKTQTSSINLFTDQHIQMPKPVGHYTKRHTFKWNLAYAVEEFVNLVGVIGTADRNIKSVYDILREWADVVTGSFSEFSDEFFSYDEIALHVNLFYGVLFALTNYCTTMPEFNALCFALMNAVQDWENRVSPQRDTGLSSVGVLCRCVIGELQQFSGMARARKRVRQALEPVGLVDEKVLESVIFALRSAGEAKELARSR